MMLAWESLGVSRGSKMLARESLWVGGQLMLPRELVWVRSSNHVDNGPVLL